MIRHAAAAVLVMLAPMIGLAAAPGATAATNLVSNPGFEAGTLAGWTCSAQDSVVGSPVHSGSHALSGAATSADDAQCTQVIPVQPNSSYSLSAWVEGNYVYLGDTGTGTSDTSTWTPSAAWFTFWSFNRDQPCPAGAVEPWAPGTCGNISQNPYDFTKIVAQYAGQRRRRH